MTSKRLAIAAVLLASACTNKPTGDADAGADATVEEVGSPDARAPDAADTASSPDAELPAPATSARVTTAGATAELALEPFHLAIYDDQGSLLSQTVTEGEGSFGPLQFGRPTNYSAMRWYDPTNPDSSTMEWFAPSEVVEARVGADNARFVVTTKDATGALGPEATIELSAATSSVTLAVSTEDPQVVYTAMTMSAAPEEGFYGFGELFDVLDARGTVREMQVQVEASSESAVNEVHVPVPFYISTAGYGLFVDERRPGAFDVAATKLDAVRMVFTSRSATFHVLAGAGPMGLVEKYTDITGKPAHVPFWALAPQWWRNVNRDQAEVLDDANRGRAAGVPSTVVWIDRPWSSYYHDFRFNPAQFPDPPAMLDELARLGYRVIVHHSPQLSVPGQTDLGENENASDGLYALYDANDWLVRMASGETFIAPWGGGNGAFVDFSAPGAVTHQHELIRRLTDLGVVGTKMDWDEYIVPNLATARLGLQFANGETSDTMHRWYSALYHKTMIEGFDAGAGEPTFHVSRSGAAGDQVWNTCIWPGDLDNDFSPHTRAPSDFQDEWNVGGMPSAIMANQSLGFVGYPCFASDIGGYRGGLPTEEVLLRWVAFGTFNAVMQLGGAGSSHMPWTADTIYSTAALDVVRKYFELRMRLFPYIRQYLTEAERTGRPLVRSMFLAYGADGRAYEDQFMFGPDLLVAPVYEEGASQRTVWLPPGEWTDYWTGERLVGPGEIMRPAPLDVIPLLVRDGAIVPMAAPGIDTLWDAPAAGVTSYTDVRQMHVRVVPSETAGNLAIFNGVRIETAPTADGFQIEWSNGAPDVDADSRIAFAPDALVIEVEMAAGGVDVTRNGVTAPLPEGSCVECWEVDPARPLVTVRLSQPGQLAITAAP